MSPTKLNAKTLALTQACISNAKSKLWAGREPDKEADGSSIAANLLQVLSAIHSQRLICRRKRGFCPLPVRITAKGPGGGLFGRVRASRACSEHRTAPHQLPRASRAKQNQDLCSVSQRGLQQDRPQNPSVSTSAIRRGARCGRSRTFCWPTQWPWSGISAVSFTGR